MANIFKKDAEGKTALSKVYNNTAQISSKVAKVSGCDFVGMVKGEEGRDFLYFSGGKPLERVCGILTAPVLVPMFCALAVPMVIYFGAKEGIKEHTQDVETAKTDNKFDIM